MALQVNIESATLGYTFPEAYAKVLFIAVHGERTHITVAFYANIQARVDGRNPVYQKTYDVTTDDLEGKIRAACYSYLKAQPEFASAIDLFGKLPAPMFPVYDPAPTQGSAEA
jgi:hypothetical protein